MPSLSVKKPEPKVASVPVTLVKPIVNEKLLAPSTSTTTKSTPSLSQSSEKSDSSQSSVLCHMWVDKYKPKTLKQVVGQQGDKSPANKLLLWLKNWAKLHLGSNSESRCRTKSIESSSLECTW